MIWTRVRILTNCFISSLINILICSDNFSANSNRGRSSQSFADQNISYSHGPSQASSPSQQPLFLLSDPDGSNSDTEAVPDDGDWNLHHQPAPNTLATEDPADNSHSEEDEDENGSDDVESEDHEEDRISPELGLGSEFGEDYQEEENESYDEQAVSSMDEEDEDLPVQQKKKVRGKVRNSVTVTLSPSGRKSQSLGTWFWLYPGWVWAACCP